MNLFNKYRPTQFADVHQPHVVRVLQAQVASGNHVSTYLFSGPPGTGKTTLARIMAMALLCENRGEGESEPDPESRSSKLIRKDAHRDVMEINCATHNGVDHVRELIAERMRIAPSYGEFRIFIMDESHMLTKQAQNALLKITEEPPPYVKFFLCTTEPNKVESAIRSRCQHHILKRVNDASMRKILTGVADKEGFDTDEAALDVIIQAAGGSARTALSILEQVVPIGVTEENVRDVLGRGPRALTYDLLKAIATQDRGQAFRLIEAAQAEGRDMAAIADEAARACMKLASYRLLKVEESKQEPGLAELGTLYKGSQLVDTTTQFLAISQKIRQNVTADLALQAGVLQTIDRIARAAQAAKPAATKT